MGRLESDKRGHLTSGLPTRFFDADRQCKQGSELLLCLTFAQQAGHVEAV
jgi:hypothetical protein